MKTILKTFIWLISLITALIVTLLVVIPLLISPDDVKNTLTKQVHKHTGRELHITGDVQLSVFPWLGFSVGKLSLSNAEGFGPEPMLQLEGAQLKIKLLPLLRREVEMDKLVLLSPEIRLVRDSHHRTNWQDLLKENVTEGEPPSDKEVSSQKEPSAGPTVALTALAISGAEIHNGRIVWDDQSNGQQLTLQDIQLQSGLLSLDAPIPLNLSLTLSSNQPELSGTLEFQGLARLDLSKQSYRLDDLTLITALEGAILPGQKLDARLTANLIADLMQETMSITDLQLTSMGIELSGAAHGQQILSDKPSFSGKLASREFGPAELLRALAISLPEAADPGVLDKAQLDFKFSANPSQIRLEDIRLQLDQSSLTGQASVQNFTKPVIRYDLHLDEIDVDRYLPPATADSDPVIASPAGAVAAGATELPLELLRKLDVDGTVRVNKLKAANLITTDIHATLKGNKGLFRLHPLGAKLYGGIYKGDLGLDVRQQSPRITLNEKLRDIQAGPLLKDFLGKEQVTGTAQLSVQLHTTGLDPEQITSNLNGKGDFYLANGALKGVNLGQEIREAYALYKKELKPKKETLQTDFADLSGSFTVKNGLVINPDLKATSPLMNIRGNGSANLVKEYLDYRLEITLLNLVEAEGRKALAELQGTPVPVKIKGSFSDPKVKVDLEAILKAKVKKKLKNKVKDELKKELEDALEGILKF